MLGFRANFGTVWYLFAAVFWLSFDLFLAKFLTSLGASHCWLLVQKGWCFGWDEFLRNHGEARRLTSRAGVFGEDGYVFFVKGLVIFLLRRSWIGVGEDRVQGMAQGSIVYCDCYLFFVL